MALHRDGNHLIHLLFDIAGNALAFVADNEGQFASCIPLVAGGTVHVCAKYPETGLLELVQGLAEIGHTGNGHMGHRTCGGFGHNRRYAHCSVLGNDDTCYLSGVSGPQDRAKVVGVCQSVQDEDERILL